MPDAFWDAKDGVKGKDLRSQFDALSQFKAADDVRRGSLPASPDAYKFELGKDWVAPVGAEDFKLDANDPRAPHLKDWAHRHRVSQDALSELIGIGASTEVMAHLNIKAAQDAEIAKLGSGPTATNRISAINTYLNGTLSPESAKALQGALWTAGIVKAVEELIGKATGLNSRGFSQAHREPSNDGKLSDADYDKLTPRQKLEYAQKFQQPGQANGRAA